VRTAIALVANAVGLIVAALVLEGMRLGATGFVVAVVVFTIVFALLQPFLATQFRRGPSPLIGGVALIATLASLIVTVLVTDGLSIDGIGTWIAATVLVWLAAVVAAFVLPFLCLKKYLDERATRRAWRDRPRRRRAAGRHEARTQGAPILDVLGRLRTLHRGDPALRRRHRVCFAKPS